MHPNQPELPSLSMDSKARPAITPAIVAEHGLKPDEYQRLLEILGREPSLTELGIFSVMWSEHCSYKSCLLYTSPSPRDGLLSRMPSSA